MNNMKALSIPLALALALAACNSSDSEKAPPDQVLLAWAAAGLGPIDLESPKENTDLAGECRQGKVAGLQVQLCEYKDALAADGAKPKGLATIGSNTGAALVRDRYLFIVADTEKVDIHGKKLNKLATIFLSPAATMSAKLPMTDD